MLIGQFLNFINLCACEHLRENEISVIPITPMFDGIKTFICFALLDVFSVEAPLPSIDFTADWEENLHGKLGVGKDFQINYADSRLKAPVLVQYKFNDGPDFKSEDLGTADENGIYHATISIPIDAVKVEMWFKHENDPDEWDSDFGKNYVFPIEDPSIVFLADYQERQHGDLVPGGTFDLFYDSSRLKEGAPVKAQMKFLDDTVVEKALHIDEDVLPYETAVISIPNDAEKVVLWFKYTDENGKTFWDSDFGANYDFPLA